MRTRAAERRSTVVRGRASAPHSSAPVGCAVSTNSGSFAASGEVEEGSEPTPLASGEGARLEAAFELGEGERVLGERVRPLRLLGLLPLCSCGHGFSRSLGGLQRRGCVVTSWSISSCVFLACVGRARTAEHKRICRASVLLARSGRGSHTFL